jgi:putative colanic acid polymerase
MLNALLILASISVLQAVLGYRFGSFVTSPLGEFSYQYQYKADLNSTITRASGLYSEPSFNALVCLSLLPIVLSIKDKKKRIVYSIISSGYMISTYSLTGIVSLGLIFLLWSWEDRKIRLFPILSFAVLFLFTSNYVYSRWQSLTVDGSSANYRIVAPLRAILEVIPNNLMGIPLGSLEVTIRKFEFLNGNRVGSSVDNGYLLLVLYFGLIGVVGVIFILMSTLQMAARMHRKKMYGWQMILVPSMALNFNGGIFLPDFLCVLTLVIITIRMNIYKTLEIDRTV